VSEAIVHLGGNKTGSTALQQALLESRDELAASGIAYPDFSSLFPTGPNQHWALALGFQTRPHRYYLIEAHRFDKQATQSLIESARETVTEAARNHDRVILSAEAFANLEAGEMQALARWLHDVFDRVHVVFYARPPGFSKFYSMFQQFVKSGHAPSARDTLTHRVYDQMGQADKIRKAFGAPRFRIYDRKSLIDNDILRDFRSAFSLPALSTQQSAANVNASLSRGAVALIHGINRFATASSAELRNAREEIVRLDRRRYLLNRDGEIPAEWDAELLQGEIESWIHYLQDAGCLADAAELHESHERIRALADQSQLLSHPECFESWLEDCRPDLSWLEPRLSPDVFGLVSAALGK
jgi:hypothetical protein